MVTGARGIAAACIGAAVANTVLDGVAVFDHLLAKLIGKVGDLCQAGELGLLQFLEEYR